MSKSSRRFIFLLTAAQRRVQNWTRANYGDVTAAQAGALFLLGSPEGILVGDIARSLGVGAPGATGLIDRMESAGLVERRPDARDGRAARLFLTEKGHTARIAAKARASEINARLIDGFDEGELDIVARWLTAVGERFPKERET